MRLNFLSAQLKALTRLLDKFDQASIARTFPGLYRHLFEQVGLQTLTLDLDSTVLSRYGVQQGASRGYNPANAGAPATTRSWPS